MITSSKISSAPVAVAELAQALEEAGARKQPGRVVRDGLDDDRRDVLAVPFERRAHVVEVVVAAHERRVDRRLEHPRGVRVAPADALGAAEHVAEHVVVEAVVAALELDQLLAAGHAAGRADRVVRGLRAGVADDGLLDRRHVVDELARQRDLGLGHADAEQDGLLDRTRHARGHGRVRVPEEDRTVGGVVVDEAVPVEVLQVCARAAAEAEPRLAPPAARVDPARNHLGSGLEQGLRRVHPDLRESK